jgi:hypothetical protein
VLPVAFANFLPQIFAYATRKSDLASAPRVHENQASRVYSLIRSPGTGRTGGQRGACGRWLRRSGWRYQAPSPAAPSPSVGCRSQRHSEKPSGRDDGWQRRIGRSGTQLDFMGRDPKRWIALPGTLRDYGRHTDRTRYSHGE